MTGKNKAKKPPRKIMPGDMVQIACEDPGLVGVVIRNAESPGGRVGTVDVYLPVPVKIYAADWSGYSEMAVVNINVDECTVVSKPEAISLTDFYHRVQD